jgi:hypothetical protein
MHSIRLSLDFLLFKDADNRACQLSIQVFAVDEQGPKNGWPVGGNLAPHLWLSGTTAKTGLIFFLGRMVSI